MKTRSPAEQKQDAEHLLSSARLLAEQMLREHGEFWPYGELLRPDGSIASVGTETDSENDSPTKLIALLQNYYREQVSAGSLLVGAIVSDIRIKPPSSETKQDAISVTLMHRDGYAADVFFPYSRDEAGRLHLSPQFAQKGESIFTSTASDQDPRQP